MSVARRQHESLTKLADISNLYARAQQQVQADIVNDKFWMWFDPLAAIVLMGLALVPLLVTFLSIVATHKSKKYEISDAPTYVNFTAVAFLCVLVLLAGGCMIGYVSSTADYNYKTTAPDAAAYSKLISYLYSGVQ